MNAATPSAQRNRAAPRARLCRSADGAPLGGSAEGARGGGSRCKQIIDRRLAGKNKSIGNRERFLRRYKEQVKEAVKRAIDGRGIRDIERGEDIHIPKRDLSEPVFGHGQGGVREMVHPGNQRVRAGDRIERPKAAAGAAAARARPATPARARTTSSSRSARRSSCRSSSRTWPCRT
jgi:hypothetical protein